MYVSLNIPYINNSSALQMLLALKSLHSALDKVTYDPRIDVFNGDTVHDIARHTGMKGASRLAQVNRNSRSAVQQLYGVEREESRNSYTMPQSQHTQTWKYIDHQ